MTHTKEIGEVLGALHAAKARLGGEASIPTAIAIAQLALKHRQNKNLRQRVLVFAGSPLADASPAAEAALVRLARKLKKNNVALDVVDEAEVEAWLERVAQGAVAMPESLKVLSVPLTPPTQSDTMHTGS